MLAAASMPDRRGDAASLGEEAVCGNRVIVHAPGFVEGPADVRSAFRARPCTGSRTSAHRTLKAASSGFARSTPEPNAESLGARRVSESEGEVTSV
jgi:hypothetical protein